MAITSLANGILSSLVTGNNQPGLSGQVFTYPGANAVSNTNQVGIPGATASPTNFVSPLPAAASSASTAAAQQAAATAAQNAAAASAINAGYGQVNSVYDSELNSIPDQINDAGNIVNDQYNSQKQTADSNYAVGNSNLNLSRSQLSDTTAKSIRDLATSIRNSYDSYSTLIGADGAGDSSATGQLSYALSKAEAQNRSNIYDSESQQEGQIGQQQTTLDASHADALQQLDAWKAEQVTSIGQQFRTLQQQIEEAKAGSNKDQLLALANLNASYVNQAVAALSGVQNQYDTTTAAIKNGISKLSLNTANEAATNFTPTAATVTAPTYTDQTASSGDNFVSATPYYTKLNQTS